MKPTYCGPKRGSFRCWESLRPRFPGRIPIRIDRVTIQNLVDHKGGWDSNAFDPTDSMRQIAQTLNLFKPPSKRDIACYMYGEPMQYDPGTTYSYSNFCYVLLTLVVESLTGKCLTKYLTDDVLKAEGISEVFLAHTSRSERLPKEGFYDNPTLGLSVPQPCLDEWLPCAYGGRWVTESMDGDGGLVATTSALVRFIGRHAVWGLGSRNPGNYRIGHMPGTSSWAESCYNGIDFAYVFNTERIPSVASDAFHSQILTLLT